LIVIKIQFYHIIHRYTPFHNNPDDSASDILDRIGPGYIDIESGIWRDISNEAKELVKRMLHVDPNRRPTAAIILKYPWIVNRHRIPQKVLPDVITDPHNLKVYIITKI
jgi:p90 ribosomal S6 kinase